MELWIQLDIRFGDAVRLSAIKRHRDYLSVHGIYVITEGRPQLEPFDPFDERVVYFGKAIKQTVYGRCTRHRQSVTDARSSTGRPLSDPGYSFRQYRKRINYDPSLLWVVPGIMCTKRPYAISCAEEYLLEQYKDRYGRYPWCNSAGQVKHV